ncbi:hypothetical protein D9619_003925 [Psilocybe cf. subviscida]|uniref:Uncharacterized protein n=1 Tax=Psilocybe cf. subviscida TaxID=2480587 RepID=A0A8H5BR84_9AGAR|nr:hypothetical protein D9619_003925 [Psilocybe cf. subviscida]
MTTRDVLDASLGATLAQALVTGIYASIFVETIAPVLRNGHQKTLGAALILLFCSIITSLGAKCKLVRDRLVFDRKDLDTATLAIANASYLVAVVIADFLLVYRCCIVWMRSVKLSFIFSLVLLAECVYFVLDIMPQGYLPPALAETSQPVFNFISLGVTVLATTLIVYRICDVSRRSIDGGSAYRYTTEVVVESGALNSVMLLLTSILLIMCTGKPLVGPTIQAYCYCLGISIPITGIAPTLIAYRIATRRARDEKRWSQPISALRFESTSSVRTLDDAAPSEA